MTGVQGGFFDRPDQPWYRHCPDGGRCHHTCYDDVVCFRVVTCEPLTDERPGNAWRLVPRPDPTADAPGLVRNDAPDTSRQSAWSATPRTGTQRARLLNLLASYPEGLTDDRMQELSGMNPSAQRPRRIELVGGGWVKATDRRRKTRGGDDAIVWVLARPAPSR